MLCLSVPVTCEIICASGAMWFCFEFCTSCPVFVFKQPLLPCMCDSVRLGPIRYHCNQNPIPPPWQHRSGKLRAELLLHWRSRQDTWKQPETFCYVMASRPLVLPETFSEKEAGMSGSPTSKTSQL